MQNDNLHINSLFDKLFQSFLSHATQLQNSWSLQENPFYFLLYYLIQFISLYHSFYYHHLLLLNYLNPPYLHHNQLNLLLLLLEATLRCLLLPLLHYCFITFKANFNLKQYPNFYPL